MRIGMRLAVLAALACSSAATAAVVEEFKAEDWDGLAFTSDDTGQFTHCSVYAAYQNGSTLYISYEVGDSWFFSVANDSWALTEGGNFAIKFKVDRRGEIEGTGTALGSTQIGLPVEADHPFVGQLRRGNRLVISFQNNDYAFELSNSNRAMNAARDCVHRHVRLGTHTPIITHKPDEAPTQEAEQGKQTPAEQPATDDSAAGSPGSDTAAVAVGEQQTFGPWVVAATDDGAGNFVNCTAYGMHGDDQLILSYFSDGVWTFGLYRAAWSLDTNQTYYLWYNVDGPADAQGVVKRPVEAAEPTRIFFEIGDVEDIIARMESGSVLNVQLRGITGAPESLSYPLEQTHEAFEATRKCVGDHGGPAVAGTETSKEGTGVKGEDATADANAGASEEAPADVPTPNRREIPELGTKLVESLAVPGWTAAAFSRDDGTFTHCGIKADYQNGATLGVARTAGGDLILAIQHGDWSLSAGAWAPISYALTGEKPLSVSSEGQAAESNVIVANMGGDVALTETLAGATQMTIDAEGKSLSFDISDIGPGIIAIDECVAKHTEEPVGAPVPAAKKAAAPPQPEPNTGGSDVASVDAQSGSGPPPRPTGPDTLPPQNDQLASTGNAAIDPAAIHTEAAGFTTALLFRAGYPNHIILDAEAAVPGDVPPGDAVWQLGEVTGSTRIVGPGAPDFVQRSTGASELDRCDGKVFMQVVASDASHLHFTMACGRDQPKTIHFLVLPREAGGSYLFAMLGQADDSAAGAIAEAVYGKAVGS